MVTSSPGGLAYRLGDRWYLIRTRSFRRGRSTAIPVDGVARYVSSRKKVSTNTEFDVNRCRETLGLESSDQRSDDWLDPALAVDSRLCDKNAMPGYPTVNWPSNCMCICQEV